MGKKRGDTFFFFFQMGESMRLGANEARFVLLVAKSSPITVSVFSVK